MNTFIRHNNCRQNEQVQKPGLYKRRYEYKKNITRLSITCSQHANKQLLSSCECCSLLNRSCQSYNSQKYCQQRTNSPSTYFSLHGLCIHITANAQTGNCRSTGATSIRAKRKNTPTILPLARLDNYTEIHTLCKHINKQTVREINRYTNVLCIRYGTVRRQQTDRHGWNLYIAIATPAFIICTAFDQTTMVGLDRDFQFHEL